MGSLRESERAHKLPDAFRVVWEQYERRGAQMELLDAADPGDPGEAAAMAPAAARETGAKGVDDDLDGILDIDTLHARLRRRMRHSMHVMMQEHNPESYYKDVTHVEPT